MSKYLLTPAALIAVALLAVSPVSAGDEALYDKLIKEKAGAVVSIKLVLAVKINSPRGSNDQEMNTTSTGIIVDGAGLIMLPEGAFDAASMMRIPRQFRSQVQVTSTPVSIRVTFPGDTKEYDAVLGAKDSKLGLGFVLIKDLADKKIQACDLSAAGEATPKIGQTLYGVSRLGQGFDHAAVCNRVTVSGHVTKPRAMWVVQGGGQHIAEPLYDTAGVPMGIMVDQEGVGENAGSRPFLLPLKVALPTISGALKKAKAELDRILEEEEEAAEEAADEAGKKEGDGEKKDGDKEGPEEKDDGKKDDDKEDDDGGN